MNNHSKIYGDYMDSWEYGLLNEPNIRYILKKKKKKTQLKKKCTLEQKLYVNHSKGVSVNCFQIYCGHSSTKLKGKYAEVCSCKENSPDG